MVKLNRSIQRLSLILAVEERNGKITVEDDCKVKVENAKD